MRCNTLILVEEECLQWLSECRLSAVGVSELVWKQVPDGGSGDWECPTAECATSMAWYGQQARSCRRVERSRWRLAMSETGTQQSTRYCGALLWRHRWTVTLSMYRTRSATSSQCKSAGRICNSPEAPEQCVPPPRHDLPLSQSGSVIRSAAKI